MELHSPTSTPSEEEFPRLQPPAKQSKGMILNTPYVQPVTVKNFPKRENIPAEVIDRRRKSVFQNLIHNSTFAFGNVHLESQNFVFTYEGQTYTFTPKVHLVEKLSTLKKHPIFTNSVPTLITPLVSVVPPPPPTPDSHIVLKNNPAMFLTPRQHKCRLHANAGMHCQCTLLKYHYTISLFVPEFCFKNTLVNPKDFVVHDPSPDLCFNENTSHVYHYNSVEENHILSLTSPFLLSKKWPPKAYLPATSLTSDKAKLRQFFTLADPHYYRTVREIYLDQPENWSEESHPFFGEPSDRDELSLYSRPLYSAETLNRTLFTVHPTFGNEIPVFSCTNQQLETPILSMSHKNLLDDFLDAFLSPFLLKGHGSILCPVCISHISNSKYPAFLSRSEFRAHTTTTTNCLLLALPFQPATTADCMKLFTFIVRLIIFLMSLTWFLSRLMTKTPWQSLIANCHPFCKTSSCRSQQPCTRGLLLLPGTHSSLLSSLTSREQQQWLLTSCPHSPRRLTSSWMTHSRLDIRRS